GVAATAQRPVSAAPGLFLLLARGNPFRRRLMSTEPTRTLPPDPQVTELLAAYQAAQAAGQSITLQELEDRYPDLADKFRACASPPAGGSVTAVQAAGATPLPASQVETLAPGEAPPPTGAPCVRAFGDYELLGEIARGGMGVVFKAQQKSLHRTVALKMILSGQLATPNQVRRFRISAEEAGNLDHPNIVPIYQVGEQDGQHYFTMKLIEGGNLGDQVARFRDDPRAAGRLVATVARAVHHAHQRGILHRDLKPGNILLD